jgi:hypothetical protein
MELLIIDKFQSPTLKSGEATWHFNEICQDENGKFAKYFSLPLQRRFMDMHGALIYLHYFHVKYVANISSLSLPNAPVSASECVRRDEVGLRFIALTFPMLARS